MVVDLRGWLIDKYPERAKMLWKHVEYLESVYEELKVSK